MEFGEIGIGERVLKDGKLTLPPLPSNGCEFRFHGGPRDGQVARCQRYGEQSPAISEAEGYWFLTRGGEVGRSFGGMSPGYLEQFHRDAKIQPDGSITGIGLAQLHVYEVVDNELIDEVACVSCIYRGTPDGDAA